jgi:manganese oxidase
MVARHPKHGLMTELEPDSRFGVGSYGSTRPAGAHERHADHKHHGVATSEGGAGHSPSGHDEHHMKTDATLPQIVTLGSISAIAC